MSKKGGETEKAPSAWSLEVKRFKELFNTWLDYQVDKFFDLSIRAPEYRSKRVLVLRMAFIVMGFIVEILLYSLSDLFLGKQASASAGLASLSIFAFLAFFRLLFILLIPTYIAIEMAGNYITDIFELKDPAVAWKFINQISLEGAREVLHIRDGKVAEADKDSPIVQIGGPGRVELEFDTAVLFEKPDGTPHVIGPADAKSKTLDGFERLREPIINLRDQYFGYTASDAISVENRSLDGIPVSAKDVRVVFSIRRNDGPGSQRPEKEKPFLYDPQSVQDLIYQQSVQVLQGEHPSGEPAAWSNMMRGMVSGEISSFMSQNKLSEFLASISTPEIEALEYREDKILAQTLQYSNQPPDTQPEDFTKPSFHPRTELTDRFMKYADGFSRRANERGMDLHWIGVGTWKATNDVIDVRHLEAWRLNLDNAMRSSNEALEQAMEDAYLTEKLRLIKNVPLDSYKECRANLIEKEKCIEALLQNFWEQMGNVLESYYASHVQNDDVDQLEKAILRIEKLLNIPGGQHMVGGGSLSKVKRKTASNVPEYAPPAPSSKSEEQQYRALLTKLDGNYKVVEAMIANEQRRYQTLTREEAIVRIIKRLERYGR
ncbi:MAG TPA: hypothetical protein VLX61_08360 [Anaerolineales bacterium]|nr:hypothetical protein [Anaerolineales bacterium]